MAPQHRSLIGYGYGLYGAIFYLLEVVLQDVVEDSGLRFGSMEGQDNFSYKIIMHFVIHLLENLVDAFSRDIPFSLFRIWIG